MKEGRFGYHSIHYLVRLGSSRRGLPEYRPYSDLIAEIQCEQYFQHAWAEMEHDIEYKSVATIPALVRRRFTSLAGMLEIADREFQAIQDEDERLKHIARTLVEEGALERVEITGDALKSYLDKRFGPGGRMTSFSYDFSYEWMANILLEMGFSNFAQIDECIAPYDPDQVSRVLHGTRQGQLRRFEDALMAGMGDQFPARHRWGKGSWFRGICEAVQWKLKRGGIAVGEDQPTSGPSSSNS